MQVTVYLKPCPVPGGMMRVGVPEYRLPYDLVQQEIDDILAEGRGPGSQPPRNDVPGCSTRATMPFCGSRVRTSGVKLPIPGVDLPQVHMATDFLRRQPHSRHTAGKSPVLSSPSR
jgi:NADPH-dependent glutamate synthase beta subunit-like oxidoreductase